MKINYITGLLFLVAAQASHAVLLLNIASNPNTGSFFVNSDNTSRIPDGSFVRVGTFNTAPSATASFSELSGQFTEFATTTSGHTVASGANKGLINRTNIADGPAAPGDSAFTGKQVYLWVYNSDSVDKATATGIFTSTNEAWKFAASPDDPPVSLSTSLINTAYGVGFDGSTPGINPAAGGVASNYRLATLAEIPEVSSAALTLLGTMALGLRRRRK